LAQTGLKGGGGAADPYGTAAKDAAIKAGDVSGIMVGKVAIYAYGGTIEERTAELLAIQAILTQSEQGKGMLAALEARRYWFGFGSVKPFDLIMETSGGSHTFVGTNSIILDRNDVGASYKSLLGGGTFTFERIFAHELGHAAMGARDDGFMRMNNVSTYENVVMRQLGDPNDRIAY
jgi:hypothetical protein